MLAISIRYCKISLLIYSGSSSLSNSGSFLTHPVYWMKIEMNIKYFFSLPGVPESVQIWLPPVMCIYTPPSKYPGERSDVHRVA